MNKFAELFAQPTLNQLEVAPLSCILYPAFACVSVPYLPLGGTVTEAYRGLGVQQSTNVEVIAKVLPHEA